jgi:hydroxymethylpyrimidine/phosphomethylpyrimidine kinase
MEQPMEHPVVLTVAGFDPSSGAGVTADIKTIAAHGCYGVSCITALTVQSTRGVKRVIPANVEVLRETLEELAKDFDFAAVHVGMLGAAALGSALADFLEEHRCRNIVLDPLLKATSGAGLTDADGIEVLRLRLFKMAALITPNLAEAAALTGTTVENLEDMHRAMERLHTLGAKNVVITGGHLPQPVDLLSENYGAQVEEFAGERIESNATHGTGCAFSTSVACNLARGMKLGDSVRLAGEYVRRAIANAYPVGTGTGPVNHLFGRQG